MFLVSSLNSTFKREVLPKTTNTKTDNNCSLSRRHKFRNEHFFYKTTRLPMHMNKFCNISLSEKDLLRKIHHVRNTHYGTQLEALTLDMPYVQPILNGGCALPLGYLVSQHLFDKDCGFADFFVKRFARHCCVRTCERSGKNLNMLPKHLHHAYGFLLLWDTCFTCCCHQVVCISSHASFIGVSGMPLARPFKS